MSDLEAAGRALDMALARLELKLLFPSESKDVSLEWLVGILYRRWKRALIEERERRLCGP